MKINKFLQKCFKKIFKRLFILFYGKITISIQLENNNYKKHKINKILLGNNRKYNANYIIYEIPNGRVYTDTIEHVAIIKDNKLLSDISYQQVLGELKSIEFNKVLSSGTPRLIKKIKGQMLSLVQGASGENYFHFLFDIVSRLKIFEQKYSLEKIDFFYVPGDINFQKIIFKLFAIDESKLISSKTYRHIEASKLFAVNHPWYHKGYVQNEIANMPNWIIFWLREKFLNLSKKFDCNDKIFIDRSESKFKHCQLLNNHQVIAFLESKGFTSYKIGELDFLEQVYLFNNAKVIIGPHGAAFSNIIFSKPKTEIIEIIPDNHPSIKCQKLSKTLDLNYTKIIRPKITPSDHSSGDMEMDTKIIEDVLKKLHLK